MRRKVVVNDRMQKGFVYYWTEPVGRNFAPGFTPDLTPKQMLALGVFGGKYVTDCRDEFLAERLDQPAGSARMVSVVLPVLRRAQDAGRRETDQTVARHCAARRVEEPKRKVLAIFVGHFTFTSQ